MTAVRKIVDGDLLAQFVAIPANMRDMKLEIIIKPAIFEKKTEKYSLDELYSMYEGSHAEALANAIPDVTGISASIDELRAERRSKYECLD
jgi:hypothetical protein